MKTHHSQHPKGGDSSSLQEHVRNRNYRPHPISIQSQTRPMASIFFFPSSQKGVTKPFFLTPSPIPRALHLLIWL